MGNVLLALEERIFNSTKVLIPLGSVGRRYNAVVEISSSGYDPLKAIKMVPRETYWFYHWLETNFDDLFL